LLSDFGITVKDAIEYDSKTKDKTEESKDDFKNEEDQISINTSFFSSLDIGIDD
jgi:hypothetical protein